MTKVAPSNSNARPTAGSDYAEVGLSPIRLYGVDAEGRCLCPNPDCPPKNAGKHPVGGGWERAPIDGAAVDAHLARGGNVGLRMGEQPGGTRLVALDQDEDGALERAEGELGPLPATLTARTGGGGEHRVFEWPEDRDLPANRVKVIPGIDVRSQGGQIVVEPSRSAKGAYAWIDWCAPEPLPPAWCDALLAGPAPRERTAVAGASPAVGAAAARDEAIAGLLLSQWAPAGEPFGRHDLVRAIGSALAQRGLADASIETIVAQLPSDQVRARVRQAIEAAAQARAGNVTIGFDYLRQRLGDPLVRAIDALTPTLSDLTLLRRLRGESASERTEATPAAEGMPLFLVAQASDEKWHLDPRVPDYVPFVKQSLHASLRETGLAELVPGLRGSRGALAPAQALIDEGPTATVHVVEIDFTRSGRATWDAANQRVLVGVRPKEIERREDADVDAWLRALFGAQYPAACTFIASCAQEFIGRPAIALAILGPDSIGKTLIGRALAGMWGAKEPVKMRAALEKFNAVVARCPIVIDDECEALKAKVGVSTEVFRQIVQDESRDIEPKGLEKRILNGCQRFIITGNDESDIKFTDAKAGALQAIGVRLVIASVPRERREELIALLAQFGAGGRVDMARVQGHLAWIQAEHRQAILDSEDRFIGGNAANAEAAVVCLARQRVETFPDVFDPIVTVLTGSPCTNAVFIKNGELLVRVEVMAASAGATPPHVATELGNRIRAALELFKQDSGRRVVKLNGKPVTCTWLNASLLMQAAQLEPETVLAALDAGDGPTAAGVVAAPTSIAEWRRRATPAATG